MKYGPKPERYDGMIYRYCGRSGLKLPVISMGLWHNFGQPDDADEAVKMITTAFDAGITHFDLANNYGPPPGAAEEKFGKICHSQLKSYRDELIISTKAGYNMWPGPYGEWGSRKYLIASLDQSLRRMKLEYVDIYYSHRYDPNTPLEETIGALDTAVRQGKALYAGISSYGPDETRRAHEIFQQLGTPCLIHQPSYSILNRWIKDGLTDVLSELRMGCIAFSPLSKGLLTNRYLSGIPAGSRAEKDHGFLGAGEITEERLSVISKLNDIAESRDQSLAQMALAWVLNNPVMTSVITGASSAAQIRDNIACLNNLTFSQHELDLIDETVQGWS